MARYIIGVDEVGRGSLAGPVVVAAFSMPAGSKWRIAKGPAGKLRDSKRLTAKQREAWFEHFRRHPRAEFAVARVYPRVIERINIAAAANLAALRAVRRLSAARKLPLASCRIFLDGGLYLGTRARQMANERLAKTVIGGDEKINAVMAASIVAKVLRDRQLSRLAKRYPQYGFDAHKGYGTKMHLAAIRQYGPSDVHRATFLPVLRSEG